MEEEYEHEHTEVSKKGRHRKKLLYNSIIQLMEFYFSDANLAKDKFLSQLINENPFVTLDIFLKFNKIRKLNCTLDDIRKAISKSDLLELSEDKEKIKRKLPIKVNTNVDNCTVYVENIKSDANHEWISQIFSEFGNVVFVSIPKYRHNKTNKGFAFVEFEDEQAAKASLNYFESIGCKMPSETSPENLKSIQTFEKSGEETPKETENTFESVEIDVVKSDEETQSESKRNAKRKLEEVDEKNKKIKLEDTDSDLKKGQNENVENDETENKKKKKHKKDKKKNIIKELGLQVLSKSEWKKMRNRYLDLQKKKMKEFKQYLYRQKFSNKNYDRTKKSNNDFPANIQEEIPKEEQISKLEFTEGVIVKIKLPEPVLDAKKIKNEIKALSTDIKYVDVPLAVGSEEIFVRFSSAKSATNFCAKDLVGDKTLLEDDEEKMYWEKVQNDRSVKFSKNTKKQRGRDKLLKKAEKERAKHIKFEDGE